MKVHATRAARKDAAQESLSFREYASLRFESNLSGTKLLQLRKSLAVVLLSLGILLLVHLDTLGSYIGPPLRRLGNKHILQSANVDGFVTPGGHEAVMLQYHKLCNFKDTHTIGRE